MSQPKMVALIRRCNSCGAEVQITITKRQAKAIYKAFQCGSPMEAEILTEKTLGRDEKGDLKR